jgi:tRNA pseudouridine38-40 synthase
VAPPPSRQLHPMPPCEEHKALPWHAIYRAQGKLYVYRMFAGEWIDPLLQRYVYSEYRPLPKWAEATALLQAFVGTHDFGAFAHTPPNKADRQRARLSTVRTVRRIDLVPDRDGGFVPVWQFQFELNGALYRMIRNLIGTFLAVARGDLEAELVLSALQRGAQGRTHIATRVKPAPAHGLCLEKVFYADGYPQKCDYQSGVLTKNADAPQRSARGAPNPVSNVLT